MRFLERLKHWATASTRSVPTPRHPDLHPINVPKLANELKLKEQAQRLGAGGIPAADAEALCGPEAAVVQKIETYRQGYFDWAVARQNLLSADLGKLQVTSDVNRALHADQEFKRNADKALSERDADLRAMAESARAAQAELDGFKAMHGLAREARVPTRSQLFMLYAILGVVILIEGAVNANFFAHGMDSGFLGGLVMAGLLAAVNVALAFSLGKFVVRYVFHRNMAIKLLGGLATLVALSFVAAIGFGIAHYRDSLQAEAAQPAQAAYAALASGSLPHDIMSWVLFAVSCFFGILALVDGVATDDPYPGYGNVYRRTKQVIDDYDYELEGLREKLEELKEDQLELLDTTLKEAQGTLAVYESRIDEKDAAALRLKTALQNVDHSLAALLSEFRTENELHRNGLARPRYFDHQPALRELQFPDFSTADDRAALATHKTLVQTLVDEVQPIRARIQEAFNHQYDLLKPLGTHYRTAEAQ